MRKATAVQQEEQSIGVFKFAEFLDSLADRAERRLADLRGLPAQVELTNALDEFELVTINVHKLFGIIARERHAEVQEEQPAEEEQSVERQRLDDAVDALILSVNMWRTSNSATTILRTIRVAVKPELNQAWLLSCNSESAKPELCCSDCEIRRQDTRAVMLEAVQLGVIRKRGTYIFFGEKNIGASDSSYGYTFSLNVNSVSRDPNLEFELRKAVAKAKQLTASEGRSA